MIRKRSIGTIEFATEVTTGNKLFFQKNIAEKISSQSISFSKLSGFLYGIDNTPRPYTVLWELTNACDFNCPFCYIHTGCSNDSNFTLLRWHDVKDDIDYLIENGMLICTLSGGEPFLHPDFTTIYRYLKEHGVLVRVFSNLSLLTPEIENLFLELPPFKLEVSLYGSSESTYAKTTGQRRHTLTKIQEDVLRLRKKGINVICKTALNSLTFPDWHDMENWCHQNGIPYFFSYDLQNRYDGSIPAEYELSLEDKLEIFKQQRRTISMEDCRYECRRLFECDAGKTGLMISHDFSIRPCLSLFANEEYCISAVRGQIGAAIEEMIRRIEAHRGEPLPFCTRCEAVSICRVCAADFQDGNDPKPPRQCDENRYFYNRLLNNNTG